MHGDREWQVFLLHEVAHEVSAPALVIHVEECLGQVEAALFANGDQAADAVILRHLAAQGRDVEPVVLLGLQVLDKLDVRLHPVFLVANDLGTITAMEFQKPVAALGQVEPVADHVEEVVIAVGAQAEDHHHGVVGCALLLAGRVHDDDAGQPVMAVHVDEIEPLLAETLRAVCGRVLEHLGGECVRPLLPSPLRKRAPVHEHGLAVRLAVLCGRVDARDDGLALHHQPVGVVEVVARADVSDAAAVGPEGA